MRADEGEHAGLQDRALIALVVFSWARIGAALAMRVEDVYVQQRRRRALAAGIDTPIGNHTFRATGITTFLKNRGTLENAAAMANHASTPTTQLYDRRQDDVSLTRSSGSASN